MWGETVWAGSLQAGGQDNCIHFRQCIPLKLKVLWSPSPYEQTLWWRCHVKALVFIFPSTLILLQQEEKNTLLPLSLSLLSPSTATVYLELYPDALFLSPCDNYTYYLESNATAEQELGQHEEHDLSDTKPVWCQVGEPQSQGRKTCGCWGRPQSLPCLHIPQAT